MKRCFAALALICALALSGVAYDITDNFAVDLGYRYVNLGYYEVDLPEGGKVKNQPSNHEFMLGLRYTF